MGALLVATPSRRLHCFHHTSISFPARSAVTPPNIVGRYSRMSTHFLRLDDTKTLAEVEPRRIFGYLTIACPTSGSEPILTPDFMSYEEFKTGFVRLALEPADAPSEDHHKAFRVKEKVQKSRDFDGYSGAPVYFYYNDDGGQAHLGWVGIIRAGGNGLLHVHLADVIKRNYLSARTRPGAGAPTPRPRD